MLTDDRAGGSAAPPVRVCFVCSGNICRSPTAEVVFSALAADAGLAELVEVSSAGTGGWHMGEDMDRRSRATMLDAGYDVGRHSARRFEAEDLEELDVVVALDHGHLDDLRHLARQTSSSTTIVLLRQFDPELRDGEQPDVADPYYGGASGFTDVLAQIERSSAELLAAINGSRAGQQDDRLCL